MNDLQMLVSRSMVTVQSQIVICRKDKGSNVVLEGNKGLSWHMDQRCRMNHAGWKVESCFYCRRCKTDRNIKKYKNTLHVELGHYFIILHWKMKAKDCVEEANSHSVLWPFVNTPGRPFVHIESIKNDSS